MDKLNIVPGVPILQAVSAKVFEQDSVRNAFKAIASAYTEIESNFFVSGCLVSTDTVAGTTTVTLAEGYASFGGEPICVPAQTIDHEAAEVVWLQPIEESADQEQYLNNEQVPVNLLVRRTMKLYKGENYPAADQHLKLDGKRQSQIMAELMGPRLKRVGEITMIDTNDIPLANFDATGLGQPGTNAAGLAICNGLNGTFDMRGLAPVGSVDGHSANAGPLPAGVESSYTTNEVFGKEQVQLTVDEMPKHRHDTKFADYDASPSDTAQGRPWSAGDGVLAQGMDDKGGDQPHENRQPSRAVIFVKVVE